MLSIQHAFLSVTEALTHSHGLSSAAHCTGNTACYHCGKRHISVRVNPADRQTDRRDISIDQQSIQTHYLHITTHAADCTNLTHERADNHTTAAADQQSASAPPTYPRGVRIQHNPVRGHPQFSHPFPVQQYSVVTHRLTVLSPGEHGSAGRPLNVFLHLFKYHRQCKTGYIGSSGHNVVSGTADKGQALHCR